jgi:hypothetical protein
MKADYYPNSSTSVVFIICGFALLVTEVLVFLFLGAEPSVAPVLPEYKVEPTTTITARP